MSKIEFAIVSALIGIVGVVAYSASPYAVTPKRPTQRHVRAVITQVYEDPSPMGCIGTNWNTAIRTTEGYISRTCHRLGNVGDQIAGCWETSGDYPGFRTVCSPDALPEQKP